MKFDSALGWAICNLTSTAGVTNPCVNEPDASAAVTDSVRMWTCSRRNGSVDSRSPSARAAVISPRSRRRISSAPNSTASRFAAAPMAASAGCGAAASFEAAARPAASRWCLASVSSSCMVDST